MAAVGSVIVVAVVIVSAADAIVCCEVIAGVDVMVVVCSVGFLRLNEARHHAIVQPGHQLIVLLSWRWWWRLRLTT